MWLPLVDITSMPLLYLEELVLPIHQHGAVGCLQCIAAARFSRHVAEWSIKMLMLVVSTAVFQVQTPNQTMTRSSLIHPCILGSKSRPRNTPARPHCVLPGDNEVL